MSIESFRGTGGAQLFYRYDDFTDPWRDSPTIVLAHGFSKTSKFWYAWVPLLSRHFRVVRPDNRGLGLSKVTAQHYELERYLDTLALDAIALLDHLRVEKVVWIGEATGGVLGLLLSTRIPERLHSLVLTATPLNVTQTPVFRYSPREVISAEGSIKIMVTKGMRAWASAAAPNLPWTNEAPPGYVKWYLDEIAQEDARFCAEVRRAGSLGKGWDMLPLVKDIGVPTLYIDGDRDSHLIPEWRQILQQHPMVRMVRIEGPGYDMCYARPEACVAQVKAFLQELKVWPN